MDELSKSLKIKDQTGWYAVKVNQLQEQGGGALLNKYNGSLCKLLQTVYPEYLDNIYLLTTVLLPGNPQSGTSHMGTGTALPTNEMLWIN